MLVIDRAGTQFALVVSAQNHLLGAVTDGDIRRGILKNVPLEEKVETVMNKSPFTLPEGTTKDEALALLQQRHITHVPLVDKSHTIKSVISIDDLFVEAIRPNTAVLMVGGLGSRLGELTTNCPKPMLKIGGKPILEIIVENLREHGFRDFIFCVNYRAEMIHAHFGDGRTFGINIRYVQEPQRMGTAGALTLLPPDTTGPLLIMNGDIVTKVNFSQFIKFHQQSGAMASMGVRKYDFQIPFGVVDTSEGRITQIQEKPIHSLLVSAGIYMIEKAALTYLKKDSFFDMPEFFDAMIANDQYTQAFPIHEYWLDIGRETDLNQAQMEYSGRPN